MPFNNIMNSFKRRMMESKIKYDKLEHKKAEAYEYFKKSMNEAKSGDLVQIPEPLTFRDLKRYNYQIPKEIKMQKMTREEAKEKLAKLGWMDNSILDVIEALGLIEFEKETEKTAEKYVIRGCGITDVAQAALNRCGYQIVKKRELIHTPSIVYLSELGSNVNFKCIKDALACYGLIVVKSTNECGKPSVDLEPNRPGL